MEFLNGKTDRDQRTRKWREWRVEKRGSVGAKGIEIGDVCGGRVKHGIFERGKRILIGRVGAVGV
jgi:hypothetical protein